MVLCQKTIQLLVEVCSQIPNPCSPIASFLYHLCHGSIFLPNNLRSISRHHLYHSQIPSGCLSHFLHVDGCRYNERLNVKTEGSKVEHTHVCSYRDCSPGLHPSCCCQIHILHLNQYPVFFSMFFLFLSCFERYLIEVTVILDSFTTYFC
jgi:hypothetical protein